MIKQVDCTLVLLRSSQKAAAAEEPAMDTWEGTFVPQGLEPDRLHLSIRVSETAAQKRLDQSAKELAEQGGRTEQHYDVAHSLFTK